MRAQPRASGPSFEQTLADRRPKATLGVVSDRKSRPAPARRLSNRTAEDPGDSTIGVESPSPSCRQAAAAASTGQRKAHKKKKKTKRKKYQRKKNGTKKKKEKR